MHAEPDVIHILKNNGVGIMPTDTLYGLVGRALSPKAVKRVATLKKRNSNSPFIILISSLDDLDSFAVALTARDRELCETYWPGKVSIILSCSAPEFSYLHLGTNTLAFRIPDKKDLLELLKKTGPLVAPSANHPGEKEAVTIEEARKYFGEQVDFYVDEGTRESLPSTLLAIENGKTIVLRNGAVKI